MGMGRRGGCTGGARSAGGWWRAVWVSAGLAVLAGCGPGGPFAPPPRAPVAAPKVVRPAARPAPPRPPALPRVLPNLPASEDPPPPDAPGEPAAAPVPSLARLPAARVEALLGAPAARAPSGTGERWSYRGPGCTVELFLFPGVGSGGLVVLDRRATGAGEQECLRRIRAGGS
jgi:predicted small lipoprotein YifL